MSKMNKPAPKGRYPADSHELEHCVGIISDWCQWAEDKDYEAREDVRCYAGDLIRDFLHSEMVRLSWSDNHGYPHSCCHAYTLLNGILEKPDLYHSNLPEFEKHAREVLVYRLESDAAIAGDFKSGRKKGSKGLLYQAIYQLCSEDTACRDLDTLLQAMRDRVTGISNREPGKLIIQDVDRDDERVYYLLPDGKEKSASFKTLSNHLTEIKKNIPEKR